MLTITLPLTTEQATAVTVAADRMGDTQLLVGVSQMWALLAIAAAIKERTA